MRGLRAVLEARHPSWLVDDIFTRLARAGVALCLTDWRDAPVHDVVTTDFVYVRRHGSRRRYGGRYAEAALRADARRIRGWLRDGRDVYPRAPRALSHRLQFLPRPNTLCRAETVIGDENLFLEEFCHAHLSA